MFEWKKQYENIDKLRPKQLKNEFVRNNVADYNFRIEFLVLFINTLCESTSMGKCNMNPLNVIRRSTNFSFIDWCNFIVDLTKKVYNPEKESSFFYGPKTYIMLLYVDSFKFDHLQVLLKRPIIFYWTSENTRLLEDILQDDGGFGYGEINELYVEEECQESGYDEEESDGYEEEYDGVEELFDDDEEEFDAYKVSSIEVIYSVFNYDFISVFRYDFYD
uniref:Uncharacterized protein n=1 Tax=Lactuca sativa TaxID=4236 RepID=A0A9R1UMQ8_LACSA|nr:hypothetical protein LSAT_V11C800442460 [Lactuca sativa]